MNNNSVLDGNIFPLLEVNEVSAKAIDVSTGEAVELLSRWNKSVALLKDKTLSSCERLAAEQC